MPPSENGQGSRNDTEPWLSIGNLGAPWSSLCPRWPGVRDGRATARGAAGESRAGDLGKERREDPGRQSPGRPPAADSVGTAGPLAGITDVLYRLLDFCVIMIDKE